jgi:hypothetical protein
MTTFRSKNYFFRIDNKEAYGVVAMSFFVVRIGRLSMEKWHTLGIDLRRWAHLISQWAAIFVGSLWNMQGLHTHKTRNEKGSGSLCGSQQTTSKSTLSMQKLATRPKALPRLGCSGSDLENGHNFGHTF